MASTVLDSLRPAIVDLAQQYEGVFSRDTIERFVVESYEELAKRAKVDNYLHISAERFAHDRLRALARAEAWVASGVPEVLFVWQRRRPAVESPWVRHRLESWDPEGHQNSAKGHLRTVGWPRVASVDGSLISSPGAAGPLTSGVTKSPMSWVGLAVDGDQDATATAGVHAVVSLSDLLSLGGNGRRSVPTGRRRRLPW